MQEKLEKLISRRKKNVEHISRKENVAIKFFYRPKIQQNSNHWKLRRQNVFL